MVQGQATVRILVLVGLLDPDSFQNPPFPVVLFCSKILTPSQSTLCSSSLLLHSSGHQFSLYICAHSPSSLRLCWFPLCRPSHSLGRGSDRQHLFIISGVVFFTLVRSFPRVPLDLNTASMPTFCMLFF